MAEGQDRNRLGQRFGVRSLLSFAAPSIIMLIFLSLYTIVDGIFVARYVGSMALSGLNMFWPAMTLEYGIATMLGAGGSALIAKRLGDRRPHSARTRFTALILLMAGAGVLMAALGTGFCDLWVDLLGANEAQRPWCREYLWAHFWFSPFFVLQFAFQTFFVVAGRPHLGMVVTLVAGLLNMALDYLFIALCGWGLTGAAIATGLGCVPPTVAGILFFSRGDRTGELHFSRPMMRLRELGRICSNGLSELVTHLANFVTGYLFNISFLAYLKEPGVAALAIVFYFEFVYTAVFMGYASGVSPIISFKYGAKDYPQLRFVVRCSYGVMLAFSVAAYLLATGTISSTLPLFVPADSAVYAMATRGFPLYALAFLLQGVNIFASAHFTALNNGVVSAIISAGRTFLFLAGCILLLPRLMGISGLWLAQPAAELLGLSLAAGFFLALRKRYRY